MLLFLVITKTNIKNVLFSYTKEKSIVKKKLPEPHETQEKKEKKLHVMISASQYQSTEKD